MIHHLARTEYPVGEHAEKLLYFLKLIYPVSLLMLGFFALGLWLAYLFWIKFAKRLHESYQENDVLIERMTSLIDGQNALLSSIESQFDEERSDWAGKVKDRDHELENRAGQLKEAASFSTELSANLDAKVAELAEFDQKFKAVVGEKDTEIERLEVEVSKTSTLRKELADMIQIASELRSELQGKTNLGDRIAQLEEILAGREEQVRELREKLELRE